MDVYKNTFQDIIAQLGNLLYETIFIMNANNGKIEYLAPSSELVNILDKDAITLPDLLEKDVTFKYFHSIEVIKAYVEKTESKCRRFLTFIINTNCHIGHLKRNYVTIKLTPFQADYDSPLSYLLGCLSLPTSIEPETIQVFNSMTDVSAYYDFTLKRWIENTVCNLSEIQKHVLILSAQGLTVQEISEIIFRAPETVKSIRKRLFEKLGVANITEAIIYAMNHKLI